MDTSKGFYHILVADDDPVICKMVSIALIKEGYWVETAGDGEEALQRISRQKYAALVLDEKMPYIPGSDVIREIRGKGNTTPAYLMSAEPFVEVRPRYEGLEFVEFFSKPLNLRELKISLARKLGSSKV